MITHEFAQFITFLVACYGLYLWAKFGMYHNVHRFFSIAPIIWVGHITVYYMTLFLIGSNLPISYGDWSAALSLHGVITVVIIYYQISLEYTKHEC